MLRVFNKKLLVLALSAIGAMAVAVSAYAYFSGSGSGTGTASVGSTKGFAVSVSSDSSGSLYPGYGSEALSYTIKNNSGGVQNLARTTVAVADDGAGNITSGGHSVAGCKSTWFTATDAPPAYGEIQGGQSVAGTVTVRMQDVNVSQDSCQGVSPDINVTAG
jgi:hypothetical protein